ncbi:MAG: MFS transporter [Brevundimonas sp.]|nr:MAG: MFS transporter [Brevundimonas sp.]
MSTVPPPTQGRPAWAAVYAMGLCIFVLIASEFLPVSLLSPIAQDLGLTEGQAGQAISISGVFAVAASLLVTVLAGRFDRRHVLLALTSLLVVSGTIVALAPNFLVLMAGRALLGIAIGGFWSMAAAMVMRLVPSASVPRGLAIIYGGNAIATTVAAPLGSFMGGLIGWRGAFFCVVPLAVVAVVWQAFTLPSLPAGPRDRGTSTMGLLKNRTVALGLAAVVLLYTGQFALFTYLRPYLEQVTGVDVTTLSLMLLVVGIGGLVGTSLVRRFLDQRLHRTLALIPALMAVVAIGLAAFGSSPWITGCLLAAWGLLGTAAPVGWSTWLTRTLPNDAEAGGGLMVATMQLAITVGATAGGFVFDAGGPVTDFLISAAILAMAAVVAFMGGRANAGMALTST